MTGLAATARARCPAAQPLAAAPARHAHTFFALRAPGLSVPTPAPLPARLPADALAPRPSGDLSVIDPASGTLAVQRVQVRISCLERAPRIGIAARCSACAAAAACQHCTRPDRTEACAATEGPTPPPLVRPPPHRRMQSRCGASGCPARPCPASATQWCCLGTRSISGEARSTSQAPRPPSARRRRRLCGAWISGCGGLAARPGLRRSPPAA